jgi:hypothetical protein
MQPDLMEPMCLGCVFIYVMGDTLAYRPTHIATQPLRRVSNRPGCKIDTPRPVNVSGSNRSGTIDRFYWQKYNKVLGVLYH